MLILVPRATRAEDSVKVVAFRWFTGSPSAAMQDGNLACRPPLQITQGVSTRFPSY